MKKITIYLVLLLISPVLLQAQYTGGDGNGDASISLTNVHLKVHKIADELPAKYELYQNYPNPFNPATKIKFDVPKTEFRSQNSVVKLIIYDILGKEVTTLVNEGLKPGTYEVTFDGYNLSSGVYFYKLEMENIKEIKKMILLK